MTTNEKIAFLMETIPTDREIQEIKRRYLLNGIEVQLLEDASRTLQTSSPDQNLIEWAYAILQIHKQKREKRENEKTDLQTKMERLSALFSSPEDLHRIIDDESWGPTEKRNFQLVSHFVANRIPLSSNAKIVEKVYDLLENSYLPKDIASKYFGKKVFSSERDLLLEKYQNYRRRKEESRSTETYVPQKRDNPAKRYGYILGAVSVIAIVFLSGFFTAKLLYENGSPEKALPIAQNASTQNIPDERNGVTEKNGSVADKALEQRFIVSRVSLQEGLENYGVSEKIDFATKLLAQSAASALPHGIGRKPTDKNLTALPLQKEERLPAPPFKGPLKIAVTELRNLQGLKLPLEKGDGNISVGVNLPKTFKLKASESAASRIVYLENGEKLYPVETYSFVTEPTIVEYRLIQFKPDHYLSVPSNIWRFSESGEMRMHKHFVYQGRKAAPLKVITNYFLPNGETLETVSVEKRDRRLRSKEFLLARRDYLPSAKLLYKEEYSLDKSNGSWHSRLLRQVWYDEGKKILTKETAGAR